MLWGTELLLPCKMGPDASHLAFAGVVWRLCLITQTPSLPDVPPHAAAFLDDREDSCCPGF